MMNNNIFAKLIAQDLGLSIEAVGNTLTLLDEGCTIPFISRYRKERTGGLDEVQIAAISDMSQRLQDMAKRKETIVKTITEQEKMTPELQKRIDDCWDSTELEDIYLPYKPRRRTRAQIAREQGLEPLAEIIMLQRERDPEQAAARQLSIINYPLRKPSVVPRTSSPRTSARTSVHASRYADSSAARPSSRRRW